MAEQYLTKESSPRNGPVRASVLIVDGYSVVRTVLHDWLRTTFPECAFREASSAEDALAIMVTKPADIVLIEINLPQMNGIQAMQRMRTIAPQVQVVVMSFYEDDPYRAEAEAAGASAFVPKRTLGIELIPILTKLLRQPIDRERQA